MMGYCPIDYDLIYIFNPYGYVKFEIPFKV